MHPRELTPLHFEYLRTFDSSRATFEEFRVHQYNSNGKKNINNEPRTDREIIDSVKGKREEMEWFLMNYWRQKQSPHEQLEIRIGNQPITAYNYNPETPFTDEHLDRMGGALDQVASRFPKAIRQLRWILVDDIPQPSAFGDPENYPFNGSVMAKCHAFRFLPRGMGLFPHRIAATTNFEGTFVHEMTHLIVEDFKKEWHAEFKWDYCQDFPEEWEGRTTPDGMQKRFFNKKAGFMSTTAMFALQPEQCINYYARQNPDEDICDSVVAYVYNPDLLQTVSLGKYQILSEHGESETVPPIDIQRIPYQEIKLPEIKPEIIYYFVKES